MSHSSRPERVNARSERSSQPLRGQDVGGAKDGWTSSLVETSRRTSNRLRLRSALGGKAPPVKRKRDHPLLTSRQ